MDSGIVSGIVTVVFIVVFIGIVWWAYSKDNRQRFEEAGHLPFDEARADRTPAQGEQQ